MGKARLNAKILQGAAGTVGELWLGTLGFDFGDGASSYLLELCKNPAPDLEVACAMQVLPAPTLRAQL